MARIVWLTGGLAPTITGIERVAVTLVSRLLDHGIAVPEDFRVQSDRGSELRETLSVMGLECVDPGFGAHRAEGAPRIVHNFGRTLRARRGADTYLFSTWDWGPFRDRDMHLKTRLAWGSAMTLGHARATDVHYLNARLPGLRPTWVPRPQRHLVCLAETSSTHADATLEEPEFALFVGTATRRKRLDVLARLGHGSAWPIVLLGQGTEAFTAPNVHGRGRVGQEDLDHAYARAACLVLISSYEGFGVPILEAARRGVHSVVSPEVLDILPPGLQRFCHPVPELTAGGLATTIAEAAAARATTGRFTDDLLQPLLDFYSQRLQP